jgi:hypothetical protein
VVLVTTAGMWTFRDPVTTDIDLNGFDVEALDGVIGRIDEAPYDVRGSFVIVDTGPWIFGKKVMFPAGVIERIDVDAKTVRVRRTREEIKNAPAFNEDRVSSDEYRGSLYDYYGPGGPGWRENPDVR